MPVYVVEIEPIRGDREYAKGDQIVIDDSAIAKPLLDLGVIKEVEVTAPPASTFSKKSKTEPAPKDLPLDI